jgi:multiple antibiotic resistance protein
MIEAFLLAFGTLFPIANPLSTAFVFNSLAAHKSKNERKKIAIKASITAAIVLMTFMLLGNWMLEFFGITIYAFRVAGGIYLGKIGFEMLNPELRRNVDNYTSEKDDISIIPLAIPLISGPGAMTATLVLAQEASLVAYVAVGFAIIALCISAWLLLRHAHYLTKVFGHTGTSALERILGLIVLVIAVQFLFNGITGYMLSIGIGL